MLIIMIPGLAVSYTLALIHGRLIGVALIKSMMSLLIEAVWGY